MCLEPTLELVGRPPEHDFRLYWTSPWFSCALHHPWADGEFEIARRVRFGMSDMTAWGPLTIGDTTHFMHLFVKPFLARAEYRNGKWIWLGKEIDMSPYFFRGLASRWDGE